MFPVFFYFLEFLHKILSRELYNVLEIIDTFLYKVGLYAHFAQEIKAIVLFRGR